MNNPFVYLFKSLRQIKFIVVPPVSSFITRIYFQLNGIKYGSVNSTGIPHLHISLKGDAQVGHNFVMGNWMGSYATGVVGKCRIEVRNGAKLRIGNNVGMTMTTLVCHEKITIKNNVSIGVGVHIYDTDFHALDWNLRLKAGQDWENKVTKPITIEDNVFIGAQSIILKGVTIGARSIIGAGSVVTKSIPPDVIAAGNPCRVIRDLTINEIIINEKA